VLFIFAVYSSFLNMKGISSVFTGVTVYYQFW